MSSSRKTKNQTEPKTVNSEQLIKYTCEFCECELPDNNPEWKTQCTPCFIKFKRMQTHKKCEKCDQHNIKKDSQYSTCYVCNQAKRDKEKSKFRLSFR